MARARFQVLIIPFRRSANGLIEFAVTRRADMEAWQFLSGGGENNESPIQAARREAWEEGGIPGDFPLLQLDSVASIPAVHFGDHELWGSDVYVVPEYTFGVDMESREIELSSEHVDLRWLAYDDAKELLTWDSNKIALWELNERLMRKVSQPPLQ